MGQSRRSGVVLVLTQVFVPDPAAVGQYMADASVRLSSRGLKVRVLTADRGYEDPSRKYAKREMINGVEIRRLPFSSTGKTRLWARLVGQLSFLVQCAVGGLFTRNVSAVLCTTSPPFGAAAALLIGRIRNVPVHYWLMDVNPDQAVVTGQLKSTSLLVKALNWLNRQTLERAATVLVLDRFMQERMVNKVPNPAARLEVIPPWPLDSHIRPFDIGGNDFRRRHGLVGKRVVMYSGNHSPVHPLDTLLAAAKKLEHVSDLVFVFVGGGRAKSAVDAAIAAGSQNLRSLPYQPLEKIGVSLSAADVHVVSLGDNMVGIVHPSKVYNAMLVSRPLLYFGPQSSHVTDLLDRGKIGWRVDHGDVKGAMEALTEIALADAEMLTAMGEQARAIVLQELSPDDISEKLCDLVLGGRLNPQSLGLREVDVEVVDENSLAQPSDQEHQETWNHRV